MHDDDFEDDVAVGEAPTWLEIVQVSPGEVELRREGEETPLVAIRFSDETQLMLGGNAGEVARGMIGAGLQILGDIQRRIAEGRDEDSPVLH